jgi:tetratricopeptide (TPR) repeat protein
LNRTADALACFERILKLDPRHVEAAIDSGVSFMDMKRNEEALAAFDRALAIQPAHIEALVDRASVLSRLKRYEEARDDANRALAADANSGAAWHNLGTALSGLKRYKEAIPCYDKAIALTPANATSWSNRGGAMVALNKRKPPSRTSTRRWRSTRATPDAWLNLSRAFPVCGALALQSRQATGLWRSMPITAPRCAPVFMRGLHACDWARRDEDKRRVTASLAAGIRMVNVLDHRALCESEEEGLIAARLWTNEEYSGAITPLWRGERYRHDKIRVAYISTDFRAHAVAFLIVGCLEQHDKSRFETTAVSLHPGDGSETRRRLETAFDRFVNVHEASDADVAAMLREQEIDIAIDLNGYTGDARTGILARRPAPVQVNYLGYPGTMGAPFVDYIIADRMVIPEEHRRHYSEQVVYLPHAYQANDRKRRIAERNAGACRSWLA